MSVNINSIILDKNYTYSYRDMYNEQCKCEKCELFRKEFPKNYTDAVTFLVELGINIQFPLEIIDCDIDHKTLQRQYVVYYVVKGVLPNPIVKNNIGKLGVTLRSDEVALHALTHINTEMKPPFFIVEMTNIFLKDNHSIFEETVKTGSEIEFTCGKKKYFLSRKKNELWYIVCEQDKQQQMFSSSEDILRYAMIDNKNINQMWNELEILYWY